MLYLFQTYLFTFDRNQPLKQEIAFSINKNNNGF
jgi:hypothetical protein